MPPIPARGVRLIGWAWYAALVVLAVVQLRTRRRFLALLLAVACLLTIASREFGTDPFMRELVWDRHLHGLEIPNFRAGAIAMKDYYDRTAADLWIPVCILSIAIAWPRRKGGPEP